MAGGLHEEIIWPPVRVFADGYYQFSSKPSHASSKPCPKPRPHVGGPGMQAVFLDSGLKPCGTGVFFPRSAGLKPAKKPAFAPVLLPSRVVHALNLNVHELGVQIKPRDGTEIISKERLDRGINRKNKGGCATSSQNCVISQKNRNSSPEIFLPKEWTY